MPRGRWKPGETIVTQRAGAFCRIDCVTQRAAVAQIAYRNRRKISKLRGQVSDTPFVFCVPRGLVDLRCGLVHDGGRSMPRVLRTLSAAAPLSSLIIARAASGRFASAPTPAA